MYTAVAAVPEDAAAAPNLISVSDNPSLLSQPAGHLLRSKLNPSGPSTVLPSACRPHPFCSILATVASRSSFHNASHSSMEAGSLTGACDGLAAPAWTADSTLRSMRPP